MRGMGKALGVVVMAAGLPALGQGASTPQCVLLEVSGPATVGKTSGPARYSASQVVDLTFRLHLSKNLSGSHVVQFRAMTPTGALYQAIDLPIVDPTGGVAGQRKLAGYPFPLKEQRPVKSVANGTAAWAAQANLPVGGTSIVANGLYGTWTVAAMLDGYSKPLCSSSFRIDP